MANTRKIWGADAQGEGGRTIRELADMDREGTLDDWLGGRSHIDADLRKTIKHRVRSQRTRDKGAAAKAAAREASLIPPATLLDHFKGSTSPLLVQYYGASGSGGPRRSDYQIVPPTTTPEGKPNTWFDHNKYLSDLFATRQDVQVTGIVHPSTKNQVSALPHFEGALNLQDVQPGPSSRFDLPASMTRPSAVTIRASRSAPGTTEKRGGDRRPGMTHMQVERTLDFDPEPPYLETEMGKGQQRRYGTGEKEIPDAPSIDHHDLPGTLSLITHLAQSGMLDIDHTRRLLGEHSARLGRAQDAANAGGFHETMADIDSDLAQQIDKHHTALYRQRLAASKRQSETAPISWDVHTLRRPRPDEAVEGELMDTGGFVVEGSNDTRQLITGSTKLADTRPVTSYNSAHDPAVHRAQHVRAWAHAILTGDTTELEKTSAKVGDVPSVAAEDVNASQSDSTRRKKAGALGEAAAQSHSTHQSMVDDMTGGVNEGQNFLYRLAQEHGVDPNEGHAHRIIENANAAIQGAPATAGQRLIGLPPARLALRKDVTARRTEGPEEVTTKTWMAMAKTKIGRDLVGDRTSPLPALKPGQAEPVAPSSGIKPEPGASPEEHAIYHEAEKNRLAIQGEIDTWKQQVAEREQANQVSKGVVPTPSQTAAAPYISPIRYNPERPGGPGTPAEELDSTSFTRGFHRHRTALIEAYRRSDAADSLFPGGRGNRLAEVALGTAKQQSRLRGEKNAAHNIAEV